MATTTTGLTIRKALAEARRFTSTCNAYLSGAHEIDLDGGGKLYVRNRRSEDGGSLLGIFQAERVNNRGETVRVYAV